MSSERHEEVAVVPPRCSDRRANRGRRVQVVTGGFWDVRACQPRLWRGRTGKINPPGWGWWGLGVGGVQMAGPVGDASSSDQTARGAEQVPGTPLKCFPAGRRGAPEGSLVRGARQRQSCRLYCINYYCVYCGPQRCFPTTVLQPAGVPRDNVR